MTAYKIGLKIQWFKQEQPHLVDYIDFLYDLLAEINAKKHVDFFTKRGLNDAQPRRTT